MTDWCDPRTNEQIPNYPNWCDQRPLHYCLYKYIPHSKLFSETDGYIVNDTSYIEISFSDPTVQESSTNKLPFSPFP